MASFNQAMKTIALLLGIRHSEYGELFALSVQGETYSKSKIKSWFCGFHDHKYRGANAIVFEDFCKGAYLLLSEASELSESIASATDLDSLIRECFKGRIPELPLMAVRELARVGTEDPSEQASVYSRQLHVMCQGYLQAESLDRGFATSRDVANHRFSGLIWACCLFSRRIENPVFNSTSFELLCELADRDLRAQGAS